MIDRQIHRPIPAPVSPTPALNADYIKEFSANDWPAPMVTYVVLAGWADLRKPRDPARFGEVRALATLIALAVNVITI